MQWQNIALHDTAECSGTKPDNLTFEEAASIPLVGMTALPGTQIIGAQTRWFYLHLRRGRRRWHNGHSISKARIQGQDLVVTTASKGEKEGVVQEPRRRCSLRLQEQQVCTMYMETVMQTKFDVCFDTTAEESRDGKDYQRRADKL